MVAGDELPKNKLSKEVDSRHSRKLAQTKLH